MREVPRRQVGRRRKNWASRAFSRLTARRCRRSTLASSSEPPAPLHPSRAMSASTLGAAFARLSIGCSRSAGARLAASAPRAAAAHVAASSSRQAQVQVLRRYASSASSALASGPVKLGALSPAMPTRKVSIAQGGTGCVERAEAGDATMPLLASGKAQRQGDEQKQNGTRQGPNSGIDACCDSLDGWETGREDVRRGQGAADSPRIELRARPLAAGLQPKQRR